MRSVMKARQDNDVIYHIGAFYTKNDTELLWLTGQGVFYDENKHDNEVTNRIGAVYTKNDTKLSWPIGLGTDCDVNQIGQQCDWLYKIDLYPKWN